MGRTPIFISSGSPFLKKQFAFFIPPNKLFFSPFDLVGDLLVGEAEPLLLLGQHDGVAVLVLPDDEGGVLGRTGSLVVAVAIAESSTQLACRV